MLNIEPLQRTIAALEDRIKRELNVYPVNHNRVEDLIYEADKLKMILVSESRPKPLICKSEAKAGHRGG